MKMLLTTTAIMVALGVPTMMFAETADPTTTQAAAQDGADTPAFLANRRQSDVFVTELIGRSVFARRTTAQTGAADQAASDQPETEGAEDGLGVDAYAAENSDGTNNLALMTAAELEGMDNIGTINEIVLSHDGKVRAIVVGIGGFLGVGEQDVAVTMDQVTFGSNSDDRSEIYVVVNTGAEMLQTSPKYDRTSQMDETGTDAPATERTAFVAPSVEREGYNQVAVTDVSSEMLMGKSVYGLNDNSVGTIDDLILDDQGAITNVVIDFGGFLGMGTSQVSVGFDELTILTDEGRSDVRIYVDATKEQVQAQPQYKAIN